MYLNYHTERVVSGWPPDVGYYVHIFLYLEDSECTPGATIIATIGEVASAIPYAGIAISALLKNYAGEIVAKNQGLGVDIEMKLPIAAASGLSSYIDIKSHQVADASSIYEGYFADLRVCVSGTALGSGTTPDGWIRLSVDLNMGAGGSYLYFEVLPPPPQPVFKFKPGATSHMVQALPTQLHLARTVAAPQRRDCICALAVQDGNSASIPPPAGHTQIGVDLNQSVGGDYIYVSYMRGPNPLTGVAVVAGSIPVVPPPAGFTEINVDLNKGAGGKFIYLCYK